MQLKNQSLLLLGSRLDLRKTSMGIGLDKNRIIANPVPRGGLNIIPKGDAD